MTDAPNLGTLPDFGIWNIGDQSFEIRRDAYAGIAVLTPVARGVSVESFAFDGRGQETRVGYPRMMKIVVGVGFRRHVGIEYEGASPDEMGSIRATRDLPRTVLDDRKVRRPSRTVRHWQQQSWRSLCCSPAAVTPPNSRRLPGRRGCKP